jgi:hypothetical protein
VETAERPESGRLRAESASATWPRVLKRSSLPRSPHPGLPLAAEKRILTTAAKSILRTGRPTKRR